MVRVEVLSTLNGGWSFCWAERPADLPDRLSDDVDWDTISVPGVWQLDGYDRPIYRNHALTWERIPEIESEPDPPNVPEEFNPVGTYRRTIDVPANWDGDRRMYLHFEGVKSAFFVWIDGEYIGYDQGSMTPSEFDVTDVLEAGNTHTLTVQVFRFSDGSYLETQDMLRFSGIFRSVYLYSKPPVHLRDYFVQTALDRADNDATLVIEAELGGAIGSTESWTIVGRLYDEDETEVTTFETAAVPAEDIKATLRTTVTSPTTWSAEQPALYDLVLELRRSDDQVVEAIPERVGFREFEIEDGQVLVNGKPMTVRGINRHEHNPETGRAVSFERVLKEMRMLKRHNVNAIRTAHYPNDLPVYEIADELGLYVVGRGQRRDALQQELRQRAGIFPPVVRPSVGLSRWSIITRTSRQSSLGAPAMRLVRGQHIERWRHMPANTTTLGLSTIRDRERHRTTSTMRI